MKDNRIIEVDSETLLELEEVLSLVYDMRNLGADHNMPMAFSYRLDRILHILLGIIE